MGRGSKSKRKRKCQNSPKSSHRKLKVPLPSHNPPLRGKSQRRFPQWYRLQLRLARPWTTVTCNTWKDDSRVVPKP